MAKFYISPVPENALKNDKTVITSLASIALLGISTYQILKWGEWERLETAALEVGLVAYATKRYLSAKRDEQELRKTVTTGSPFGTSETNINAISRLSPTKKEVFEKPSGGIVERLVLDLAVPAFGALTLVGAVMSWKRGDFSNGPLGGDGLFPLSSTIACANITYLRHKTRQLNNSINNLRARFTHD